MNKTVIDLPLFLSSKPNYSTEVLHLLWCINCTSLQQTNVSWTQAHIDLVHFAKPLGSLHRGVVCPHHRRASAELSPAELTEDAGSGAHSADSPHRAENNIASEKSLFLHR